MIWLLIGMAVDGLTTLAIGIVLSLTTAHPVMPQLPLQWHHPVAAARPTASHWDHRA